MRKVAIYSRFFEDSTVVYFQKLLDKLTHNFEQVLVYKSLYESLKEKDCNLSKITPFSNYHDLLKGTDLLLSIGGDGTLLDTIAFVRDSGIPVLGINTGRMGFLASTAKDKIDNAIDSVMKGHFSIDKRILLTLDSNKKLFEGLNYALNEFTIHKKDTSSMITIHTFLNGEFLNSYWADGLIVSTPTGSTGYSLSCGGPIIFPRSNNFAITPVAPHNLNVRPIVVSGEYVISFEIEGRTKNFLATLDSRSVTIESSVELAVRKANFELNLIRLNNENFLTTLREKLMWGLDSRN